MNNLKEKIIKNFDFLFCKDGFNIVNEIDDEELKDLVVILQKKSIRLRFIQDRVDFFLDVGCTQEPNRWYEFYKIISWLRKYNYIPGNPKASNKLNVIKRDLKQNLFLVEKLFDLENYLTTKNAIENDLNVEF